MVSVAPFLWSGNTGQMKSPATVERERKYAEALMSPKGIAQNPWEGISQITGALSGSVLQNRADDAEAEGRKKAGALFADMSINQDPNAIIAALTNPDAQWASPAQSSIASALLDSGLKRSDPLYQAQLADAQSPDQQALLNTANGIYDPNSHSWIQPPGAGENGAPPPNPKAEGDLRSEYNGINTVKDYGLQTQAYQRVLDSAKDPSPAGDLALIFNFMKVLDPGSTVREGEFATAQNSGSVPDQITAQYNKIISGERLVPEIRNDFVNRAGQLFEGASQLQQGTNDRYSNLAEQYGYDPNRIVAPIPKIGILDPEFDATQYVTPQGEQIKPIPLTKENADAEYNALPSGAVFIDPDGNERKKP